MENFSTLVPFFKFIVALALPVDVPDRNVFVSINLEANYALPTNSTNFTQDFYDKILFLDDANDGVTAVDEAEGRRIRKRDLQLFSRRSLYQIIEEKLEMHGFDGHECLLKLICEASSSDFIKTNGYLGNIIDIILRPSSSTIENDTEIYFDAENEIENCEEKYSNCKIDILKFFPIILENFPNP